MVSERPGKAYGAEIVGDLIPKHENMPPILSVDDAMAKLFKAAETIKLRGNIKPHEEKRIRGAFALLAGERKPVPSTKTGERRDTFRDFLMKLNDHDCGPQFVMLCVVGLGQSVIASMKEAIRLRLPLEIKDHERTLTGPVLQHLTEECLKKKSEAPVADLQYRTELQQPSKSLGGGAPLGSGQTDFISDVLQIERQSQTGLLSGRLFELTLQDVQAILSSDQVGSKVWLTETYGNQSLPTITLTISQELCIYFSAQRHQVFLQ
ncbi:uncharacterized protein BDCG_04111 [Blastomyces dermatitidis ER-3]|uniref:Uncharacterized protein n=1 Tax=Ajellomyces dermatitidis (strain ER-3 / ATCC MYA-2586) TaxID=559297 RepID=A0ABP2F1M3_AJEDR|nr:uncharacterized protein BDCG_04111 [Blastomyces dermatitidis ER-3]EEQ88991.2 hypothetical protein BDCG_04111 [Blastomyces dermatitidis ER-3]